MGTSKIADLIEGAYCYDNAQPSAARDAIVDFVRALRGDKRDRAIARLKVQYSEKPYSFEDADAFADWVERTLAPSWDDED